MSTDETPAPIPLVFPPVRVLPNDDSVKGMRAFLAGSLDPILHAQAKALFERIHPHHKERMINCALCEIQYAQKDDQAEWKQDGLNRKLRRKMTRGAKA